MSFTRPRRRKIKGNAYAHRVLLARTARQQRGEQLAILGSLLVVVAVVFAGVGWYEGYYATSTLDLSHLEDTPAVRAKLENTLASLSQARIVQNIAGLALIIGGGCITSALFVQRLRKRWYLFSTLILSVALLFVPFMGTVFALVWLASLYVLRREFINYQPDRSL